MLDVHKYVKCIPMIEIIEEGPLTDMLSFLSLSIFESAEQPWICESTQITAFQIGFIYTPHEVWNSASA